MKDFLMKLQRAANQFNMVDFAIFKIYIFSVGLLFGAYFAHFWLAYINIVWVVAIISCIFVLIQLFKRFSH
ncbi:MAG: hypothetical protein R3Y44_05630 [Rikenellaceae bacterium]